MRIKILLLLSSFIYATAAPRIISAGCSAPECLDTAGVFNDYDLFSVETMMQTLQKCDIWYDHEQIQQILLCEIGKATERFETLVRMPLESIACLYSAAQILTLLPNIHALCIAYLKKGGVYTDILDHRRNPIDFMLFTDLLLDRIDPWLRQDKAASFKAQLTLPFLQRMLKVFKAMSAEQYAEFIKIAFRPFSATYLMSLSQCRLNTLFKECQQKTHRYLQLFESEITDTYSYSSETLGRDCF